MKNPHKLTDTVYMTAGIKKYLLRHSEEIRNAISRFENGECGSGSEIPNNSHIEKFGSYEMSFGTLWIINYNLFADRDFITLLLPKEYDGEKYQNAQLH